MKSRQIHLPLCYQKFHSLSALPEDSPLPVVLEVSSLLVQPERFHLSLGYLIVNYLRFAEICDVIIDFFKTILKSEQSQYNSKLLQN